MHAIARAIADQYREAVEVKQSPPAALTFSVDVDCVKVSPAVNEAALQGELTRVGQNPFGVEPGQQALIFLGDGGEPSSAAPVDLFFPATIAEPEFLPPNTCKLFASSGIPPNVTRGNVVIKNG